MFGKKDRRPPRRRKRVVPPPEPQAIPEAEAKGLDAPDVIDRILRGPNGETQLTILHSRAWAEGDDTRLKRKIRAYLKFISSGQLDRDNPEWFRADTVIDLAHVDPIPDVFLPTVAAMAERLVARHGVGFTTTTFSDSHILPGPIQQAPPDPSTVAGAMRGATAFTLHVAERIAALGLRDLRVTGPFTIESDTRKLTTRRLWETCEGDGAEALAEKVESWVEALIGEAPVSEADAPLVPLIRLAGIANLAPDFPVTPFVGPLVVCYALDLRSKFSYVSSLDDIGLSHDELLSTAISNLPGALPPLQVIPLQGGGTVFGAAVGGDYEASLLLLDDFCRQMEEKVDGELVACAFARDLVYLTGSADADGIQNVRNLIERLTPDIDASALLWSGLMVRRDQRWIELDG